MFFIDRVVSIKPQDRVLEIGPGGTPHPRANIFLDLDPELFKDEEEASYQRGKADPLKTEKSIVYYDGKKFPFKDKEFDYVICSHVLEHVDDIGGFLSELFRITDKGYIEFPTILYDYIYDIPVHHNFLLYDKKQSTLWWLKKDETPFAVFKKVQAFFHESLGRGHECLIQSLDKSMMQGFEWFKPFTLKKATSIGQLVPSIGTIQKPRKLEPLLDTKQEANPLYPYVLKDLVKEIKRRARQRTKRTLGRVIRVRKKRGDIK